MHQGFLDNTDNWVAGNSIDWLGNSPHQSVTLLRRKAEVFAHFWYQKCYLNIRAFAYLMSPWKNLVLIETDKYFKNQFGYRFEDTNSLNSDLSHLNPSINLITEKTEVDYYIVKFLNYVNDQFQNEP